MVKIVVGKQNHEERKADWSTFMSRFIEVEQRFAHRRVLPESPLSLMSG